MIFPTLFLLIQIGFLGADKLIGSEKDKINEHEKVDSYQQDNIFQLVDDNYINASPCCGKLNISAAANHGVWMIHFNKLGSYTITNTLVRGRHSWVNDKDPELLITWCGDFWHIGHPSQAGQCAGYISSPDNIQCFERTGNFRHYVHCINEWVSAAPSKINIQCLDDLDLSSLPGIVPKDVVDRKLKL